MVQSCLFSVADETTSMVTWKINTNEFVAKAEFFSNEVKEAHIRANSAEGWRRCIYRGLSNTKSAQAHPHTVK